jgi:hypothetical protein
LPYAISETTAPAEGFLLRLHFPAPPTRFLTRNPAFFRLVGDAGRRDKNFTDILALSGKFGYVSAKLVQRWFSSVAEQ